MSEQYEFEGKSVEEAIERGLAQLGLNQDNAAIEVVRKGSRGILGFGGETALVRISNVGEATMSDTASTAAAQADSIELPAAEDDSEHSQLSSESVSDDFDPNTTDYSDDEGSAHEDSDADDHEEDEDESQKLTSMAIDFLEEIVYLMGYDAEVNAVWKEPEPDETEPCLMLSVEGEDLGSLIGRRGETLDSLQYLLRLMINQRVRNWRNIVVDVAGYKAKRSEQIVQLAERMAAQVIESGRAISLEPMPANERRMVHLALREHPEVYTESSGESDRRKVHIMPKSLLD